MKRKTKRENEMDCKTCGKVNEAKVCVIGGKATPDCPFSLQFGKGMICLECQEKASQALPTAPSTMAWGNRGISHE